MKIAKLELKNAETPVSDLPATDSTKNVLTTTQWLSVIGIVVSLAGIYYKREEIKGLLTKNLSHANHFFFSRSNSAFKCGFTSSSRVGAESAM